MTETTNPTCGDTLRPEMGRLSEHQTSFEFLAASRRSWIDQVLRPWCRAAPRRELMSAEQEWQNIAGRVDSNETLWRWAWERFPDLLHENLPGLDETYRVTIILKDGEAAHGFPDSRSSTGGRLVLLDIDSGGRQVDLGPFEIDQIESVRRSPSRADSSAE